MSESRDGKDFCLIVTTLLITDVSFYICSPDVVKTTTTTKHSAVTINRGRTGLWIE